MTNICHPKLITDFVNETAVYPDDDEFDQLSKLDYAYHITKFSHKVGGSYNISKSGNMNRYIFQSLLFKPTNSTYIDFNKLVP